MNTAMVRSSVAYGYDFYQSKPLTKNDEHGIVLTRHFSWEEITTPIWNYLPPKKRSVEYDGKGVPTGKRFSLGTARESISTNATLDVDLDDLAEFTG